VFAKRINGRFRRWKVSRGSLGLCGIGFGVLPDGSFVLSLSPTQTNAQPLQFNSDTVTEKGKKLGKVFPPVTAAVLKKIYVKRINAMTQDAPSSGGQYTVDTATLDNSYFKGSAWVNGQLGYTTAGGIVFLPVGKVKSAWPASATNLSQSGIDVAQKDGTKANWVIDFAPPYKRPKSGKIKNNPKRYISESVSVSLLQGKGTPKGRTLQRAKLGF